MPTLTLPQDTGTRRTDRGTRQDLIGSDLRGLSDAEVQRLKLKEEKQKCKERGGKWDEKTQTCILTAEQQLAENPVSLESIQTARDQAKERAIANETPNVERPSPQETGEPEIIRNQDTGQPAFIRTPDGKTFNVSNEREAREVISTYQAGQANNAQGNEATGLQQQANFTAQGQQLAGQVGQFNPLGVTGATPFDVEQGIYQGLLNAVPNAITGASSLLLLRGGLGAATTGTGAAGAGIIGGGAAATLTGGLALGGLLATSIIREFGGQRRDNINAQKRVLDEGKQTANDWATLAAADPANRAYYLTQYNKVLSQIDQAYRQMILDTQRDTFKFEKAIPDLAEFEEFYNAGGERDTLNAKMRDALINPSSTDYEMLELVNRRNPNARN